MTGAIPLVAGGAVQAGGGRYLERAADAQMLAACRRGDYCYVLSSRQVGKTSLMYRTAQVLTDNSEAACVIVDLTSIGQLGSAEGWYLSVMRSIACSLSFDAEFADWLGGDRAGTLGSTFFRFFSTFLMPRLPGRVIIFFDEIDVTLKLDFTDDFFGGIRALYQARGSNRELSRLSFVLVGAAAPDDLVKDRTNTPFNIGTRIGLSDFTFEEVLPLKPDLPSADADARFSLGEVLQWTGGHPYLTLRLLRSLCDDAPPEWSPVSIATRVSALFLEAPGRHDSNLAMIAKTLTSAGAQTNRVLGLYQRVRRGELVPDSGSSPIQGVLALSGITACPDGYLVVRNRIYKEHFTDQWINAHLIPESNIEWVHVVAASTTLAGEYISRLLNRGATSGTASSKQRRP